MTRLDRDRALAAPEPPTCPEWGCALNIGHGGLHAATPPRALAADGGLAQAVLDYFEMQRGEWTRKYGGDTHPHVRLVEIARAALAASQPEPADTGSGE